MSVSHEKLVKDVEHWLNALAGIPHSLVSSMDREDLLDVEERLADAVLEFDCEDEWEWRKEIPK